MFRAAPRNCRGGCRADVATPPARIRLLAGRGEVVGAAEPGDGVEQHDDVPAELDQALGPFDRQLRHHDVIARGLVEGGEDHLAVDRAPAGR